MSPWLEPDAVRGARRIVVLGDSRLSAPMISKPGREWRLERAYPYGDRARDTVITVPEGFSFDLASVPRFLWPVVAPFDLSIVAPLLHDYLYRSGGAVEETTTPSRRYTRSDADAVFRDAMEAEQVSGWRRRSAWAAVRAFGGRAWRGDE